MKRTIETADGGRILIHGGYGDSRIKMMANQVIFGLMADEADELGDWLMEEGANLRRRQEDERRRSRHEEGADDD